VKHRAFGRTGRWVSGVVFGAGAVGGILIQDNDATNEEALYESDFGRG